MQTSIIIAMRKPGLGKTRLSAVLDQPGRAMLSEHLLGHVLGICVSVVGTSNCLVVSDDEDLPNRLERGGTKVIQDKGVGFNAALDLASSFVPPDHPVLALCADLPLLTTADLDAILAMHDVADVVAAPDHHGTGTNALLLARPGTAPYCFEGASLARHRSAAESRSLRFRVINRVGLSHDLDTADDLARLWPPAEGSGFPLT